MVGWLVFKFMSVPHHFLRQVLFGGSELWCWMLILRSVAPAHKYCYLPRTFSASGEARGKEKGPEKGMNLPKSKRRSLF